MDAALALADRTAQELELSHRDALHMRLLVEEMMGMIRSIIGGLEGKFWIETDDGELESFLFSLGCYAGEPITVISHLKGGCVVSIKDGRYNLDRQLADAIIVG